MLREIEDRRVACIAWVVTIPTDALPYAMAGVTMMVHAPDQKGAEHRLQAIVSAMLPVTLGVDVSTLEWKEAPRERQPVRPVQPGIYTVAGVQYVTSQCASAYTK